MADKLWSLNCLTLNGDQSPRLSDVTLDISSGVTAVVGYSGAGKTSLLNALAGMESPDAGQLKCHVGDPVVARFDLPLFWAPQDSGLWPHLSVRDHIAAVSVGKAKKSQEAAVSLDKRLAEFDLQHRQHAFPGELSRGEQSRLAIARALAANPAVLLMDEPLAHVDPVRTPQYWSVISEHLTRTRASLIFSTHEPSATIRESQSVICLEAGQVRFSGSTRQLYDNPEDAHLARLLGPINWFGVEERATWLSQSQADCEVGVRPENMQLTAIKDGPFQILSFRFCGSYAETLLKHLPTSSTKTILHRPVGSAHYDGQTVSLEVHS